MQVQERLPEIRQAGMSVVVITQSKPEALSAASLPLPTVCDPARVAYRYFGLDRGRWSMFFRWSVLLRYLRLIFTGWRPSGSESGEDLLQLGGDFILSASRQLLYAHRSNDPADRPSIGDIIHQIQLLIAPKGIES